MGLTINFDLLWERTNYKPIKIPASSRTFATTGGNAIQIPQTIQTTDTPLNLGDVTTGGITILENIDTGINITIKLGLGGNILSILGPSQFAILFGNVTNLYGAAASGTPKLMVTAISGPITIT